ncbi:MAG: response regulator transcription factor [Actinomycetes bacterium]
MTGVRALVVDNDPFTLASVSNALEYQRVSVVARATTAREALELQREVMPDVALLDLDLGAGPTGVDLAHGLRIRQPEIGLVLLSTYRDPRLIAPGMIAMPRGTTYLSKADVHDFSTIVVRVIAAARTPLGNRTSLPDGLPPLTEAQLEVLRLVAEGRSTQAIADERNVSVKAVEQMVKRLSEILGVPRDSSSNHYVQLARAYLELAGKLPELPT